jgi:hypothetical protein
LDFETFSRGEMQLMSNTMKGLQTTLKKTIARIPKIELNEEMFGYLLNI